jgi:membrane metallo-endopeptidase-like protein 1
VTEDEFLVNILNVLRYDAYHNLEKLRQPVNKDKWSTEPAVVNAFYNPNKNDIGENKFLQTFRKLYWARVYSIS